MKCDVYECEKEANSGTFETNSKHQYHACLQHAVEILKVFGGGAIPLQNERIDPSPPSSMDPDEGDDQGNPGAA